MEGNHKLDIQVHMNQMGFGEEDPVIEEDSIHRHNYNQSFTNTNRDEQSQDEEYQDEQYQDGQYQDEQYQDDQYQNEQYQNEQYQDDQYQEEQYQDEQYTEENKQPTEEDPDPELLDKDAVIIFFNQIGISEKSKEILIKNGFDNFESLSYISKDVLNQLAISDVDDVNSILNSLSSIAEWYRNSASMKDALNNYEKRIPGTIISQKLLMRWATNISDKKRINHGKLVPDNFLPSVTHLSLDNKHITVIDNLKAWVNLKILYLSENKITKIQGLEKWTKLTSLSLERNLISKIEGLETLVYLNKLYLENNWISKLEGLHNNVRLDELNLNNQNLALGQEFTFDDLSLCAISKCLQKLELKSWNIHDPKPLYYLENLYSLNLQGNKIADLGND